MTMFKEIHIQSLTSVVQPAESASSDTRMWGHILENLPEPSNTQAYFQNGPIGSAKIEGPRFFLFPVDYLVKRVEECTTKEEILAFVSLAQQKNISERLTKLLIHAEAQKDNDPISLESMRDFAKFFISNQNLSMPLIGVTLDGFFQAEWHLGSKRHVVLKFLGHQSNRIAIVKPLPETRGNKKSYLIQLPLSEVFTELSEQRVLHWLKA